MKSTATRLPRLSVLSGMLLTSLYLPAHAGELAYAENDTADADVKTYDDIVRTNISKPFITTTITRLNTESTQDTQDNHQSTHNLQQQNTNNAQAVREVTGLENISLGELLTQKTDDLAGAEILPKNGGVSVAEDLTIGALLTQETASLDSDEMIGGNIGDYLELPAESSALDIQEFDFDSSFFGGDSSVDTKRFAKGNYIAPGKYFSQVRVNGEYRGHAEVEFIERNNHSVVCMSPRIRGMLDVKPEAFDMAVVDSEECPVLKQAVPEATINFESGTQTLNIEIPQILTINRPRGYISPSRWQDGVPTAFANYYASYGQSYNKGSPSSKGGYVHVNFGVNYKGWALRHRGSQNWTDGKTNGYQAGTTYLHKTIEPWQSQITIGDISTGGHIVDSVSLRGVKLETDDSMLPQSVRGYAPRVEGIANTSNARVIIKQNERVIYETTVSAGPFVIDDLYATGYGGELEVEIHESSGEIRRSKVPFATLISLLRPGRFKYQVALGNYRQGRKVSDDRILSGAAQYGYSNNITLNAGLLANKNYFAMSAGVAYNSKLGAFSGDITRTYAEFVNSDDKDRIQTGYSVRGNYNYNIVKTNTNIMLATYRYFSHNYYSLSETINANNSNNVGAGNIRYLNSNRPKNQYQISVSQSLGAGRGNLYVSGVANKYWGIDGTGYDYQLAYSNSYKRFGYQLSYTRSQPIGYSKPSDQFMLSVSLPLFEGRRNRTPGYLTASAVANKYSRYYSANFSQSFGETNRYNYGVSQSVFDGIQDSEATSVNVGYRGDVARLSGSFSRNSSGSHYASAGVEGAIVAHPKGITLSNQVGDSFAVVHAKHGAGATLNNGLGRKLDRFGNAIVEHTSPYAINYVNIDPSTLPMNVQFEATQHEIVPKKNSSILVEFDSHRSSMVMFNVSSDFDLPMGVEAVDDDGKALGYVGQGGVLFADKLEETKGRVHIKWGGGENDRCYFDYNIPSLNNADVSDVTYHDVRCVKTK